MARLLSSAPGDGPADAVFSGGILFNPFDCSWEEISFAVTGGVVTGLGDCHGRETHDLRGARVVPGLIDAHVHIESSLLVPTEYARAVLPHGTTTVVADPHEIANVAGVQGIEYILAEADRTPLDILVMLPSCVPSTPFDPGGATLSAADLRPFFGRERVLGLGEMMNVPGVLSGDAEIREKLSLCRIRDGHAPGLTGNALDAYILAGLQSDHECTALAEAREKLRRGMFIMVREGSTERNLRELLPLVTPCTAPRCSLATDDRHADLLAGAGHIDDCIRQAVELGLDPSLALRMATLSPCDRFGLTDRGALAPGRLADFCILEEGEEFRVKRTYKRGAPAGELPYREPEILSRGSPLRPEGAPPPLDRRGRFAPPPPPGRSRLGPEGPQTPGTAPAQSSGAPIPPGQLRLLRSRRSSEPGLPAGPGILRTPFRVTLPGPGTLRIQGSGEARVIGLVPGQISTRQLTFPVHGEELPDTSRDILKIVACDRYGRGGTGLGLVHGFGLRSGAIASSVSHDAHNIIAAGASDREIIGAVREVAAADGGMVVVSGDVVTALPLECAGLMSARPYDEVAAALARLDRAVASLGGIPHAFMHLSFLALPVIPELRITPRGLFDVAAFRQVDLFMGEGK